MLDVEEDGAGEEDREEDDLGDGDAVVCVEGS